MTTMDKTWFQQRLKERRQSMRAMARHINMDPASMYRTLAGTRRLQLDEASAIASFLAVPVAEVLKHAGVAIDLDGAPTNILLAMTVNSDGELQPLEKPRPLPQSVIDRARDAVRTAGQSPIVAAQIRARNGPLSMFDDALMLFRHTSAVEKDAIGCLSVCKTYKGKQIICKVEGIRRTGEANIIGLDGESQDVDLLTATPVLAIIP